MELILTFKYLICSWKFSASPLSLLACVAQQSLESSISNALFLRKVVQGAAASCVLPLAECLEEFHQEVEKGLFLCACPLLFLKFLKFKCSWNVINQIQSL